MRSSPSAILRLYPRAWRDRYRDELLALLEERPATLFDSLDLISGAIDARLHPQVPGHDVIPGQETPMTTRLLGTLAAIGGVAWLIAILTTYVLPLDAEGNRDASFATLGLAFGIAIDRDRPGRTRVAAWLDDERDDGARRLGHQRRVGRAAPRRMAMADHPAPRVPALAFLAAVRGARNGAMPGWLAVVFGVAAILSIAGTFGVGTDTETGLALLGSIGLAALVLAWAAISGQSTGPAEASPA